MNRQVRNIVMGVGIAGLLAAPTVMFAAGLYRSHPLLHGAHNKLEAALRDLQHATHDCGGHRVAAIQKVQDALAEVTLAVEYADAHPHEDRGR